MVQQIKRWEEESRPVDLGGRSAGSTIHLPRLRTGSLEKQGYVTSWTGGRACNATLNATHSATLGFRMDRR